MSFAKLFQSKTFGQILAVVSTDEEGKPEIRWSCKPPGLGLCAMAFGFDDSDEGWDRAEAALESADLVKAEETAAALFKACGIAVPKEQP